MIKCVNSSKLGCVFPTTHLNQECQHQDGYCSK